MKKVLIIGFGSIGQRHAANFKKLGCSVAIVSRRSISIPEILFSSLGKAIADFDPDIVFICNETYLHRESLNELKKLNFSRLIIIEKPLFDLSVEDFECYQQLSIKVSYNLRFHPLLKELKTHLTNNLVLNAQVYAGHYLPLWRQTSDYRKSYSADEKKGGGVMLDLSHELDYCQWLFGPIQGVFSRNGRWSTLEIDSMDTFGMIAEYENCRMATLQLNYTDRIGQRVLTLTTNSDTYKIDLAGNRFVKNNIEIAIDMTNADTYLAMCKNILNDEASELTTYKEAVQTMKAMQLAVQSQQEKVWKYL